MTEEQEAALRFMCAGDLPRRLDGRIDDGFLSPFVLEWAIKKGYAEPFKNKDVEFVRITKKGVAYYRRFHTEQYLADHR